VRVESPYSVEVTADRFEAILQERGLTLFNRIDHAAGGASVGEALRPTELIIFGNPAVGTPLMQCAQSVAIDLPQKALIWEDAEGQVWFGYNQPAYLRERHDISGCDQLLERIANVLDNLATATTQLDESGQSR
jgi:uncharacterized protein (DUF302 family)